MFDEVVLLGEDCNAPTPDDLEKEELKQYIIFLENENKMLKDELESNTTVMSDVSDTSSKRMKSPPPHQHHHQSMTHITTNTSTCSNRSQKLIVPLRAGFKKMQQSLNHDSETSDDWDDDEDMEENTSSTVDVILKCGNVKVLHHQGGNKRYIWKDRWLVLPQLGSVIKCYKQIKSLRPMDVRLTDCEVQDSNLYSEDEGKCFAIKTSDSRMFVVKVTTESEKKEWVASIYSAMKTANRLSLK